VILSSAAGPHRRLALGVLASAVLHCLLFGVSLRLPSWRALPAPSGSEGTAFSVRLIPRRPAPVLVLPSESRAAEKVGAATAGRRRTHQPAPRKDAAAAATAIAEAPSPEAAPASVPIESAAAQTSVAGIMEAARREAASVARGMNRAPGADADFRSRVQQDLDRHFDAAHAAAGSWTRAAGIKDITRASDGATRIYRIETPLGAFCMTYTGGSGRPSYTTCPR
jgi:hypothetical protein